MKRVFLIRHAKSSWEHANLRDIDRPLNERGKKDAPIMAKAFRKNLGTVDQLISSPANRAYTTAQVFAKEFSISSKDILIREEIYGATIDQMLKLINSFDDSRTKICLFGHNPTFTYLAEKLADINIGNLPTCGIVGIEFEVDSWAAVSLGSGQDFYYDYPKNHK